MLSTLTSAFVFLACFSFAPIEAKAQDCYDIKGGKTGTVMGIPACFCGSGLECLCITPCPEQ